MGKDIGVLRSSNYNLFLTRPSARIIATRKLRSNLFWEGTAFEYRFEPRPLAEISYGTDSKPFRAAPLAVGVLYQRSPL